jgi:glycosyltransferase involved in cell wall biosynthesis
MNSSSVLPFKNVALVHDYLVEYGGAERVLEALHELFPDAPVYVSFVDRDRLGSAWEKFADWDIRETWIARLPFYKKLYSPYRIFAPRAFADLDLSAFDLVISSSNAYFAKAVRVPNGKHVCYCHTPPRALYGYTTGSNWKANPLTRWAGMLINHYLRIVDFEVSRERVDQFIANSQETARRIEKFYRRDSTVIFPPVEVGDSDTGIDSVQVAKSNAVKLRAAQRERKKTVETSKEKYFLYVNRLALAKHPELAVEAATASRLPLKVVGTGPMLSRLRAIAGPTIEFVGFVPDEELHKLYQGAQALLYPVEDEDFGIVPVEAMGHGVPVIAHNSGGPRETVIAGKTGVLFDELSAHGLTEAIREFQAITFDSATIHAHARSFRTERFHEQLLHLLTS